jgi:hypothetical protein
MSISDRFQLNSYIWTISYRNVYAISNINDLCVRYDSQNASNNINGNQ